MMYTLSEEVRYCDNGSPSPPPGCSSYLQIWCHKIVITSYVYHYLIGE